MFKRKRCTEDDITNAVDIENDNLVDSLCCQFKNIDCNENEELLELRIAILSKENGKKILKKTYERYNRYLSQITQWDNKIYIKDLIQEYVKLYETSILDIRNKYKFLIYNMKLIDYELLSIVDKEYLIDNQLKKKLKKFKRNFM